MNRLILCLKRNDQYNPLQKNGGLKHLMPCFWHDEATTGEFILNPKKLQSEAFTHMEVDRALLPWLKAIMEPIEGVIPGQIIRDRQLFFLEDELSTALKNADLKSKWRSPDTMGMLDAKTVDFQKITKAALEQEWTEGNKYRDVKAMTSGTYLVGPDVGDDYANAAAAAADAGTMVGNLTFNANGNFTDTALANFSNASGGFVLTFGSNIAHGGDVTAAPVMTVNHNSHGIAWNVTGGGNHIESGFRKTRSTNGSNSTRGLLIGTNSGCLIAARDMWYDGGSLTGAGCYITCKASQHTTYNNVAWDCDYGYYTDAANQWLVENCGARSCGSAGFKCNDTVAAPDFRNCWSYGNTTDFETMDSATGDNNSATDTSAPGNNPNNSRTEATELISSDDTNAEYCHTASGFTSTGVAPNTATTDMAGVTYASPWTVGPFMPPAASGGVAATYQARNLNYSHLQRGS